MKPTVKLKSPGRAASRGMTLVELLVAMVIGLLLTIVIAQLFLNTRQTFATTDDMSRLQENMRFVQQLLTRTIHNAGYKSQPNSVTSTVFGTANPALATTPGTTPIAPDRLEIRYQGSRGAAGTADGTVLNCLGVAIDSGIMSHNIFFIGDGQNGLPMGQNGRPALFCSTDNMATSFEIVPDVATMKVVFGQDTNADLTADQYIAVPTNGPGLDPLGRVVSVRVALLFTTPNDQVKAAVDGQVYDMFSDGVSVLGPFNDRRIRRVMTTTVNLRNRTP